MYLSPLVSWEEDTQCKARSELSSLWMSDLLSREGSDIVHLSSPGDLWVHPCSRRNILLLSYDVL